MIIYLGIPITFALFFIWGGITAFRKEIEAQAVPAYDPNKYRS